MLQVQLGLQVCGVLHKVPWPQDKLSQLLVQKVPAGSSDSVLVIMTLACPCLYLEAQQGALTQTAILFDSRNY